jgi:hypothetical protein
MVYSATDCSKENEEWKAVLDCRGNRFKFGLDTLPLLGYSRGERQDPLEQTLHGQTRL